MPLTLIAWEPYFVEVVSGENIIISPYKNGITKFEIKEEYLEKVIPVNDTLQKGDIVSINTGARLYDGGSISWRAKIRQWYVTDIDEDKITLGNSIDGQTILAN